MEEIKARLKNTKGYSLNKNSLQCINNPKKFKEKVIELINKAKERIYIAALYVEKDSAGQEIISAINLAKSKNPSITVKIIVDYNRSKRNRIGASMETTNWEWYIDVNSKNKHKIDFYAAPIKTKELLGVMHLKGFIVDNQVIYSGASINNSYMNQDKEYRLDRYHIIKQKEIADEMVRFINNSLIIDKEAQLINQDSKLSGISIRRFVSKYKEKLKSSRYKNPEIRSGTRLKLLCGFGSKNSKLNKLIYDTILSAEEKVIIYTPYFNINKEIKSAINQKIKEGKTISIVVGDKTTSDFYEKDKFNLINIIPYIYEQNLKNFAEKFEKEINEGKLKIYIWKHGDNSFHLKGISVDQELYILTGHNLNCRAWSLDLENCLFINDANNYYKDIFHKEHMQILKNTTLISSSKEIENEDEYEDHIKKIIKRINKFQISKIIQKIM